MAAHPLNNHESVLSVSARSSGSSQIRRRGDGQQPRATRRVAEYLRALGLTDAERIDELSEEIAASVNAPDADEHAREAVARAQERFEAWCHAVFSEFAQTPHPLWLREFLSAFPEVALGDADAARRAAQSFFDPQTCGAPRTAQFREQKLERAKIPSWVVGLVPPLVLTAAATAVVGIWLASDGVHGLEVAWLLAFAFLFGCGSAGLTTATLGFARALRERARPTSESAAVASDAPLPRTALVMPIYHESAEEVFAALAAMRETLLELPEAEARAFEIFVLSDSTNPALAAEEERAFRRVAATTGELVPIYYRRRARNIRQKAGNLAEFFERWGHRYTYAVVLDADSVMHGSTVLELVKRMEASPRLALLQAPIELRGAETLFARAIQFTASVAGPIFTTGLARWSGPHGNYYGHNACLRVRAFLDCCALPELAGEPPLGGHILSHDFVEAALLCRAGWEVRIAHDLAGSYEGLPPSLPEYVARDRRWCQGNLQHLRIAWARGLKPMSRIHLLLGAFAYLASPVWLMFLLLSLGLSHQAGAPFTTLALGIAAATAVVLFLPQVMGVLWTGLERERRRAHGGVLRLGASFVLQTVVSACLAPLLMIHHTKIVLSILLGRAVRWGAQRRSGGTQTGKIARTEAFTTLCGAALATGLWLRAPELFGWFAPIWAPWLLSFPIAWVLSSATAGRVVRQLGGLLVPTEVEPQPLLERADELRGFTRGDESARFRDLVLDPVLLAAHIERLGDATPKTSDDVLLQLRQRALRAGPAGLSAAERDCLASDAASMRWLHREAWRHWPVESWQVARERPHVPCEAPAARTNAPYLQAAPQR